MGTRAGCAGTSTSFSPHDCESTRMLTALRAWQVVAHRTICALQVESAREAMEGQSPSTDPRPDAPASSTAGVDDAAKGAARRFAFSPPPHAAAEDPPEADVEPRVETRTRAASAAV